MKKFLLSLIMVSVIAAPLSAWPKSDFGLGASSLDLITLGSMQMGQGGFFVRFNQILNQYDFSLTFANGSGITSSIFSGSMYWLKAIDDKKGFKFGPSLSWSTLAGTTSFTVGGNVGFEYNPEDKLGLEAVITPLRMGFGPSSTAFQFFSSRVALIYYY